MMHQSSTRPRGTEYNRPVRFIRYPRVPRLMPISIKVSAFGLGAVLAAGGLLLLLAGYNVTPHNPDEVNGGWTLIGLAVVLWAVGVIIRESR